jgi:hypothetical protein
MQMEKFIRLVFTSMKKIKNSSCFLSLVCFYSMGFSLYPKNKKLAL